MAESSTSSAAKARHSEWRMARYVWVLFARRVHRAVAVTVRWPGHTDFHPPWFSTLWSGVCACACVRARVCLVSLLAGSERQVGKERGGVCTCGGCHPGKTAENTRDAHAGSARVSRLARRGVAAGGARRIVISRTCTPPPTHTHTYTPYTPTHMPRIHTSL